VSANINTAEEDDESHKLTIMRKQAKALLYYFFPDNQALAGFGELSPTMWLLVMGVNEQRWKEQASASRASTGTSVG
jgi:hypothetical protein